MKCFNNLSLSVLCAAFALCLSMPAMAQKADDWTPTRVWPFINRHFKTATIYIGIINRSKTVVPCNIHVGNNTLWYSQNDTLMEAIPNSIVMVEFSNGDRYMPVGSENMFGRIVREDTIAGRIARVIHIREVDRKALDQKYVDYLNKSQNVLQGANLSMIADTQGGRIVEEEPLPMLDSFYFQLNGEIFPATTKNIMKRIDQKRRKEYLRFTRSAEIISSNESSILKIWNEFFLR